MLSRFGVLIATLLSAPALASDVLPGPYSATVERIVDGDTLAVRVTIWLQQDIDVLVRVRGIDARELRGRCDGEKARAEEATTALRQLVADSPVVLTAIEGDKYFGRVVSDVATASGKNVATALVAAGVARTYHGGTRGSWCESAGISTGDGELARFMAD